MNMSVKAMLLRLKGERTTETLVIDLLFKAYGYSVFESVVKPQFIFVYSYQLSVYKLNS